MFEGGEGEGEGRVMSNIRGMNEMCMYEQCPNFPYVRLSKSAQVPLET